MMAEDKTDSGKQLPSRSDSLQKNTLPPSRKGRLWLWLGGVVLLSLGGGLGGGWLLLERQFPPLVESQLANFLKRPVKLGQLQGLSLNGVRFGPTEILTTPTDPGHISLAALELDFDPLQLVWQQKLKLNFTAVQPEVYLQQGKNRAWLLTKMEPLKNSHLGLGSIRWRQADLTLVGRSASGQLELPFRASSPEGRLEMVEGKYFAFNLKANPKAGGELEISGQGLRQGRDFNLLIRGHQVPLAEIDHLLALPVDLRGGEGEGNLELKLRRGQRPRARGTVTLRGAELKVPHLPLPISQASGQLHFQGTKIGWDKATARIGTIPITASGSIDPAAGYDLTGEAGPISLAQALSSLQVKSLSFPVSGEVKAEIKIAGPLPRPQIFLAAATTKPARIDRVEFRTIKAKLEGVGGNFALSDLQAFPVVGGRLAGRGLIKRQNSQFQLENADFTLENLPLTALARPYGASLPADLGAVSGAVQFSGSASPGGTLQAQGSADLQVAGGRVRSDGFEISGSHWHGNVRAASLELGKLNLPLRELAGQGKASGNFQVGGTFNSSAASAFKAAGSAEIALAGGKLRAHSLELAGNNWRATGEMEGIPLKSLLPQMSLPLGETLEGTFNLAGNRQGTSFNLDDSSLNLAIAGGKVSLEKLQLAGGNWRANLGAEGVGVSRLLPRLSPQFRGRLEGRFDLAGSLEEPVALLQGRGTARLNLPAGAVVARDIQLQGSQFAAALSPQNLPLAAILPQGRGQVGGRVQVGGNWQDLSPTAIAARGQLDFSKGIGPLNRPLRTAFTWNGKRLDLTEAAAPGLAARGWVDLAREKGTFQIQDSALKLAVAGIDLKDLPLPLPSALAKLNYGGQVDFRGILQGRPQAPKIEGELALKQFHWQTLPIESILTGKVKKGAAGGIALELQGSSDRLQLALDPSNQILSFALQVQEMAVRGQRQQGQLLLSAENLPLNLLSDLARSAGAAVPPTLLSQPLGGELSGNFSLNLENLAFFGHQVGVVNPRFGPLRGDRLTGDLHYHQGKFTLDRGQFQYGKSQYGLKGSWQQTPAGPSFQGEISLARGQVQDILEVFQVFEWEDLHRGLKGPSYGTAAALYGEAQENPPAPLASVGKPQASLREQMQYLSEIQSRLQQQQQQRQAASPLPELGQLQGEVRGKLQLALSPATGFQAAFDVSGSAWHWGNFTLDRLEARGRFQDGAVTLEPLRLQAGESLLAFSGNMGGPHQSGRLELAHIPLKRLADLLSLTPSLNLDGSLNGSVALGGSRANPLARGELAVENATINQTPLQKVRGEFRYKNARLHLAATSLIAGESKPLTLEGSLPYKFPFASIEPDSERFGFSLQARDGGLALLGSLTGKDIAWVSGKGALNLDIFGAFDPQRAIPQKVLAEGIARVEGGTIAVGAIPGGNLTDVSGEIRFDFDHIDVTSLQGRFSGGKVAIAGTLPLSQALPQQHPLTVSFDNLAFNLSELYQGGVKGQVQVTGSALSPRFGGQVELFDGTVFLDPALAERGKPLAPGRGLAGAAAFDNLNLTLGRDIQIAFPPILNFAAAGNLILNGKLGELRPQGTISLKGGYVNLFATLLRLAGGENTAQFFPERGLDPYLQVELLAAAAETVPNTTPADPLSSEVREPFSADADSLRTVRVQARVQGFASQLGDSIKLTSIPSRSQREIVTLLGGNVVNTLGRGETALGLSNLASSAVFGGVQGAIGDALGLSQFRVFTTPLIDEKERISDSQIGIAAEASADLTDNISLSILKIVNTDRPPQVGLRYRINENLRFGGTSNFVDEGRAAIEFEQRF